MDLLNYLFEFCDEKKGDTKVNGGDIYISPKWLSAAEREYIFDGMK